ncbi:unnamed protein product, partial [Amoebophrya sp. A120]
AVAAPRLRAACQIECFRQHDDWVEWLRQGTPVQVPWVVSLSCKMATASAAACWRHVCKGGPWRPMRQGRRRWTRMRPPRRPSSAGWQLVGAPPRRVVGLFVC